MHLDIPNIPFAGCAVDTIDMLPTTSKGHRLMLTFICLLTSYLITVPLKTKKAEEITMAYLMKCYQNIIQCIYSTR